MVLLPTRSASYQRNASGLSESSPSKRIGSVTVVKKSVIGPPFRRADESCSPLPSTSTCSPSSVDR